jgi:hypothetical protein
MPTNVLMKNAVFGTAPPSSNHTYIIFSVFFNPPCGGIFSRIWQSFFKGNIILLLGKRAFSIKLMPTFMLGLIGT